MSRLTPEYEAVIRQYVQADIPGQEQEPRTTAGRHLFVLLAEIDALRQEIRAWECTVGERVLLAARVRELEEELSEVVDDSVHTVEEFPPHVPMMRGTPHLPEYIAELKRREQVQHDAGAARVRELEAENEKMRKELAGFYAAESRRYVEPSFCKVCPHALAFHNADGSCPCGSDCAALASPQRSA